MLTRIPMGRASAKVDPADAARLDWYGWIPARCDAHYETPAAIRCSTRWSPGSGATSTGSDDSGLNRHHHGRPIELIPARHRRGRTAGIRPKTPRVPRSPRPARRDRRAGSMPRQGIEPAVRSGPTHTEQHHDGPACPGHPVSTVRWVSASRQPSSKSASCGPWIRIDSSRAYSSTDRVGKPSTKDRVAAGTLPRGPLVGSVAMRSAGSGSVAAVGRGRARRSRVARGR